jgi:HD superfamily phosphodiesterase
MLRNISQKDVNNFKEWFDTYVCTFKTGDEHQHENIALKEEHTRRVCKEILGIGKDLGLEEHELCLAETAALFHDIGRFEQYACYQTFVDSQSVDHSLLGIKILKENDVLCGLDRPVQDLILRAIRYHNRATLPGEETETCLFFTKLLRDADKLDIWRVVTDYYHQKDGKRNNVIECGLPDTPAISEEVYHDVMNKKIVDVKHVKNLNDFKLLQIGWVFDINFSPTFQRIKTRRYLDMLRDVLPKSRKIRDVFAVAQSFLNGR